MIFSLRWGQHFFICFPLILDLFRLLAIQFIQGFIEILITIKAKSYWRPDRLPHPPFHFPPILNPSKRPFITVLPKNQTKVTNKQTPPYNQSLLKY